MIELNQRFLALENRLATEAPPELLKEIYPEFAKIEPAAAEHAARAANQDNPSAHLVVEMMQLIEDVRLKADFERNYNHPLVVGWINAFNRWTRTKAVRRWWPFLIPLYTSGTRRFAEEHFDVPRSPTKPAPGGNASDFATRIRKAEPGDDLSHLGLKGRAADGAEKFFLEICIPDSDRDLKANWLAVGAMRVTFQPPAAQVAGAGTASWKDAEFAIRPGMWNSGLGGAFLGKIVREKSIAGTPVTVLQVKLDLKQGQPDTERGTGQRRERNDLVMFYKSYGFETVGKTPGWLE
jgi:hypothetical protein